MKRQLILNQNTRFYVEGPAANLNPPILHNLSWRLTTS